VIGDHHVLPGAGVPALLDEIGERFVDQRLQLPALAVCDGPHLGEYFRGDLRGELLFATGHGVMIHHDGS
jgi:hypothetical protein